VAAVRGGWRLPIPFLGAGEESEPEIVDVSEPEEPPDPPESAEVIDSAAVETPIVPTASAAPTAKPFSRPRKRPKAPPPASASASSSAFPPKTRL
jgi:hypothetical protein